MADSVVVNVDKLHKSAAKSGLSRAMSRGSTSSATRMDEHHQADEKMGLAKMGECRICQEDDDVKNMESPCACSGSLKFAHRKCIERWCDEKGDTFCEICHQLFKPGYTAHRPNSTVDINALWTPQQIRLGMYDPRFMNLEERRFISIERNAHSESTLANVFRYAILILLGVILLRQAWYDGTSRAINSGTSTQKDDDYPFKMYYVFLLWAMGFFLACYFIAWAINIFRQCRWGGEDN